MLTSRKIERIVGLAYEALAEPEILRSFMRDLAELTGADNVAICVKPTHGDARFLIEGPVRWSDRLMEHQKYFERRSPYYENFKTARAGQLKALGTIAFSRDFRKTEYYQDWARVQGFADIIGGHLLRTPEIYAWMSLRRAEARGPYSSLELTRAQYVAAHLARALKLHERLNRERPAGKPLHEILDRIDFGVMLVDIDGKVLMSNAEADSILRSTGALTTFHQRLACASPSDTQRLRNALRMVAKRAPVVTGAVDISISRGVDRRPLMLQVLPVTSSPGWGGFGAGGAVATVFIIDPEKPAVRTTAIADTYGLTAAEGRVLDQVLSCRGLPHAAATLGVTLATARTHLQRIFAKTGTNNQAELVSLVFASTLRQRDWDSKRG